MSKLTKKQIEKLLKKAKEPLEKSKLQHAFYRGKIQIIPKCQIRSSDDFAIWYTPGVAAPCKDIQKHPEKVFEYTNKANLIAIVSDGTRVLGLGDIGPEASLPVMEGKAILFKYLGGVDAFPICLDAKDPDKLIDIVLRLQPTFGGINLEDIAQPKCFYILKELKKKTRIPVWHDDQQGTAVVVLAGLINAIKVVNKKLNKIRIAMIGAGASNITIARIIIKGGVNSKNIIMVDSKGILHSDRTDLRKNFPQKWSICKTTNSNKIIGGIADAIKGADVVLAFSSPGPNVIKANWIKTMAKSAIVFACSNPIPEIWPWVAKSAGAKIIATGRSDFPNQVNNSLGFPGIFRGTIDVMAKSITDEMCITASNALAKYAENKGLSKTYILPTMDDWKVYPYVAAAVGTKAIEQGVARLKISHNKLLANATDIIETAREQIHCLMKQGFIKQTKL